MYFRATLLLFYIIFTVSCGSIGGATPDAKTEVTGDSPYIESLKKKSHAFEECGRDSVSVQTGSIQKIKIRFTVTAEGKVVKPDILDMSDPDPDLRYCILRNLKNIEMPKSKTTTTVTHDLKIRSE